jgi:DNA-binding NarL/FixJ family response regulator
MYKVLIVEDHPLMVEGLLHVIENSKNLSVAGVATSGEDCIRVLDQCRPDVILLDINLPGIRGTELCKIISAREDKPKIIALSNYNQRYYIDNMLNNGANGYLLKNSVPDEIINAIEKVMEGDTWFSEEIESMIKKNPENPLLLSGREIQVLKLIAGGYTNKEIADKLFISALTVDSHRKNLIQKMRVKNTAALIKAAGDEGII